MAGTGRRSVAQVVEWSQIAILRAIAGLRAGLTAISTGTGPVLTDATATSVRDVDTPTVLSALVEQTEILVRIEAHLSVISDLELKPGEKL